MPANLANVQWLSIAELADRWANEIDVPKEVVVRELRYGLYKYENAKHNPQFVCGRPLSRRPAEHELPPIDEPLIYREFIVAFCEKQKWALPKFWLDFGLPARLRGRPGKIGAIVQELERRAESRNLEETPRKQAAVLHHWARMSLPREQVPAERTIYNQIRELHRKLKD